ncbi:MAG: DUF4162 domain-containing protein, partial [Clostridia bacterium]|nr:DUF4162 domain-containing protein [Clostridia bacterium]
RIRAALGAACSEGERGELIVTLAAPGERQEMMRRLTEICELDSIRVYEPSLNDIFVEYTSDARGEAEA